MRLQVLVPLLPQNLVNALEEIGIRTDADLLFSGGAIETFGKLPSGTVQLHEFRDLMSKVAESACAPVLRGDEYSALEAKPRADRLNEHITSGVPVLDALVGGFYPPRVLEISGDRGSGKTSLALQVVLQHLVHSHEAGALWIDTTGEFSAERVSVLLQSYDGQATSTALERLQVALAFDIEAIHDILEMLRLSLNRSVRLTILAIRTVYCNRYYHTYSWSFAKCDVFSRTCDYDNLHETASCSSRDILVNHYRG
ncbi:DNA repair protein RAD51 4 [Grifola frondosa]|uniref:DNA repair protein RAD51 4 n=1 Tax=Grifola frondosa TaxID=5627 RepID=A0A1C7M6W1_GRIFR|nr:DNA repair protein RAD51 4 [Grifola frondosa]